MGLDCYLSAKLGLSMLDKAEKENKVEKIRKIFPEMFKSGNLDYINIEFEAGYWRKANAIHKWFVDNVQNGEDDCKNYYVSREQLEELKKICEKIIGKTTSEKVVNSLKDNFDKKLAEELLPTQSGFFYGNTEYGEEYLDDLKNTIEIINKCLELPEEWSFEYSSSW